MGGDSVATMTTAATAALKAKYKPAFPSATYDTQGFCLKHPMIRVCRPKNKKKGKGDSLGLGSSSETDTTDSTEDVVSPCPMCNPGLADGVGPLCGDGIDDGINNDDRLPSRSRRAGGGAKGGLFYNRESSRDRCLPPKEKLLRQQQREQRRKRREGEPSSWGQLRQRNLQSRQEIRESGLTKGRGRSVSLEKKTLAGGVQYASDSENSRGTRGLGSSMSRRSLSRSASLQTTRHMDGGGGEGLTAHLGEEDKRSRSLSRGKKDGSSRRSGKDTSNTRTSSRNSSRPNGGSQRAGEETRSSSRNSTKLDASRRSDGRRRGRSRARRSRLGPSSIYPSNTSKTTPEDDKPSHQNGNYHSTKGENERRSHSQSSRYSSANAKLKSREEDRAKDSKEKRRSYSNNTGGRGDKNDEGRRRSYSTNTAGRVKRGGEGRRRSHSHNASGKRARESRRSSSTRTAKHYSKSLRTSSRERSTPGLSRLSKSTSAMDRKVPINLKEKIASHDTHKNRRGTSLSRHSRSARASSKDDSVTSRNSHVLSRGGSLEQSRDSNRSKTSAENSKHMEEIERKCQEIAGRNIIDNVQIVVRGDHPTNLREQSEDAPNVGDGEDIIAAFGNGSSRGLKKFFPAPILPDAASGYEGRGAEASRRCPRSSWREDVEQVSRSHGSKSLQINILRAKQKQKVLALLGGADLSSGDADDALVPYQGLSDELGDSSGANAVVPQERPSDTYPLISRQKSAPDFAAPSWNADLQGGSQRNKKALRKNSIDDDLDAEMREERNGSKKREPSPSLHANMQCQGDSERTEKSKSTGESSRNERRSRRGLQRAEKSNSAMEMRAENQGERGSHRTEESHLSRRSPHAEKRGDNGWRRTEKANFSGKSPHAEKRGNRGSQRTEKSDTTGESGHDSRRRRNGMHASVVKVEEALPSRSPHAEKRQITTTAVSGTNNLSAGCNHISVITRNESLDEKSEHWKKERRQYQNENLPLLEEGERRLERQLETSQRRIERLRKLTAERCMERLRRRETLASGGMGPATKNDSKGSTSAQRTSSTQGRSLHEAFSMSKDEERKAEKSQRLDLKQITRESRSSSARQNSHRAYSSDDDGRRQSSERLSRRLEQLRSRYTMDHGVY